MEARSGNPATMGKVYSTLQRLVDKGLIVDRECPVLAEAGERYCRVYRLSEAGQVKAREAMLLTLRFLVPARYPGLFTRRGG